MEILHLLKSQTNQVFLTLTENGWNPSDFEWDTVDSPSRPGTYSADSLVHKLTRYYFTFDNFGGEFYAEWSPDDQSQTREANLSSFGGQIQFFNQWLRYLNREHHAPNLWEEMPSDTKLIESASNDDENAKFSAAEKKLVVNGLEEIKQYLLTAHKFNLEIVEPQIKYLSESANRLGRKDWKNVLVSGLFGMILQMGATAPVAQEIFQFVWTVLSTVLIQRLYLP